MAMARSRDSSSTTRLVPTFRTAPGDPAPQKHATSGRVGFDDRGNAVWEMRTDDKGYSREGSTSLVRKLQVPHLSLEATSILRKVETSVSQPLDIPTPKRAVPDDAGHTNHFDDRAGMGTVRTFPVRSSAAAKRPAAGAVGTNKRSRPGLLDRLLGRKP
jgi:hypothetical protein